MKRLLLIFIPLLLLASCNDGKKKAAEAASKKTKEDSIAHMKKDSISSLPQNRVGKYVYLDNYGVLHTRLGCVRINYVSSTTKEVTDDDGNLIDETSDVRHGSGVKRVPLDGITISMLQNACHYCVKDDMYDYLRNKITSDKHLNEKKPLGIKWIN